MIINIIKFAQLLTSIADLTYISEVWEFRHGFSQLGSSPN